MAPVIMGNPDRQELGTELKEQLLAGPTPTSLATSHA